MQRLTDILARARESEGQALVELAVTLPVLFLLVALTINFGLWLAAWIEVGNAARAAADYAILGSNSAGTPVLPTSGTGGTLNRLIQTDMEKVPDTSSSNPQVCVQDSNSTKVLESPSGACGAAGACGSSACSAPTDSEPVVAGGSAHDVSIAVDITYTYTSLYSGSRLLGIPLTVLPSSIHRHAVMRVLGVGL